MANQVSDAFPIFYAEPVQDKAASQKANRPIYKNQERVRVLIPGDRNNQGVFVVTDTHRERWPEHYKAFLKGTEKAVDGMPIEDWAYIDRAKAMELKSANVMTVEQLADMPSTLVATFGPGTAELVTRAKAHVAQDPMNVAGINALQERDELISENKKLKAQLEEFQNAAACEADARVPQGLPAIGG